MARMYPEMLRHDTASDAERRLFDAFHEGFSDDWVVFSQVRFLARNRKGGARDGEADFVVAHPRHGLLVIEVKGGGISHDARTGRWTSTDRDGVAHEIKDPFKQAADNMYDLRRKLQESELTRGFSYPMAYAVAFPDVWAGQDLGLEAPREIVFDLARCRDLKQAVVDALKGRTGDRSGEPGEEGIEALVQLIGCSWQIETTVGASLMGYERAIRLLTEEQFSVLDLLRRQRRALISGCAGSGKTMLALEKARRLAGEGYRVLLTCYNENLSYWMAQQFTHTHGVTAMNFHRLSSEFAKKAGISLVRRPDQPDDDFFNRRMPEALFDAATRTDERFDAIIVDEGQDFDSGWWLPLQALLRDPGDGILYIFFDDNQAIYDRRMEFPVQGEPFTLTRNCRNTRKIHEAVMLFYDSDDRPECIGPEGEAPMLHQVGPGGQERREVEALIDRLVDQEHVPPAGIAILTRHRRENTPFAPPPRGRTWSATWDLSDAKDKVACSTIHGFKGLERPVVIVCGLDNPDLEEARKLLYVAFSRARSYLVVVGWKGLAAA